MRLEHESGQEWRLVAVRVVIILAFCFLLPLLTILFLHKDKQTGQNQASSSLSR